MGTRVDDCYRRLLAQGHTEESAARICQAATGEALMTGKPPKKKFQLTTDEMLYSGRKGGVGSGPHKNSDGSILIRLQTPREAASHARHREAMASLPRLSGHEAVFKPYGIQGRGYYHIPKL